MAGNRKNTIKLPVMIIVLLLICTILARTIDTMLMTQVTPMSVNEGRLVYSSTVDGVFDAYLDNVEIIATDNWEIEKVFVEDGKVVERGDVLFKLDIQSFQIELKKMEANIQQKKNMINGGTWSSGDRLVFEQELQAAEMQYEQIRASFPSSGTVKATVAGIVNNIAQQGNVQAGTVIANITTGEATPMVFIKADATDAKRMLLDDTSIDCEYYLLTTQSNFKLTKASAKAEVAKVVYDKETNLYNIWAALTDGASANEVADGVPLTITITSQSAVYDALIPLSCIQKDENGQYVMVIRERNSLWGLESYVVKSPISVKESNHKYAAIEKNIYEFDRLAAYPSHTLSHNEVVVVVTK